jgi:hypothetical protein
MFETSFFSKMLTIELNTRWFIMYGQKYKILDDDAKRNKYKMRNKDDDAHPPSRCSLKTRSKARQRSNMVYS